MQLADKIISIYPQLTYDDFANGKIILQDDGAGAYIKEWNCVEHIRPTDGQLASITSLPITLLLPYFQVIAQSTLDSFAQSWGYDNIVSACSYANSTNAKFKAEALALISWRDAVWGAVANVGSATQTVEAFRTLLPKAPARPILGA